MSTIARKLRLRRDAREFNRVMQSASPSMRQELAAAAARSNVRIF